MKISSLEEFKENFELGRIFKLSIGEGFFRLGILLKIQKDNHNYIKFNFLVLKQGTVGGVPVLTIQELYIFKDEFYVATNVVTINLEIF